MAGSDPGLGGRSRGRDAVLNCCGLQIYRILCISRYQEPRNPTELFQDSCPGSELCQKQALIRGCESHVFFWCVVLI